MTTGMHVVRDCYCNTCLSLVGWRYEDASDATQKVSRRRTHDIAWAT